MQIQPTAGAKQRHRIRRHDPTGTGCSCKQGWPPRNNIFTQNHERKKIAGEIPAKSLMKFSDYTTRMRNDIRHTVNEIIKFSKLYLFLLPMAFIALAVVAYVVVHRLHFEQASIVAIMVSLLAPLVNRSYIDGLKEDMLDLLYEYNQLSSTNSSLKLKQYNLSMPDMRRPIKVARAGERALNSLRRNTELKRLLSGGKSKPKGTVVKFETAKKNKQERRLYENARNEKRQ